MEIAIDPIDLTKLVSKQLKNLFNLIVKLNTLNLKKEYN